MTDNLPESLSALMDNESDELELRRLLKSLPEDPELRQSWRSYHLIRASINQEAHVRPAVDISSRVQAALAAEATPTKSNFSSNFSNIARYLGQSAIAASVAVMVLFTAQNFTSPDNQFSTSTGLADNSSNEAQPNFSGVFEPGEFTRMARFSESDIEPSAELDQEGLAMDRIRRAVLREFGTGR